VVLVAHSNAGLFLPVIAAALPGQVRGCILVDAALPPPSGATSVAPPELLGLLRDKALGGCCRAGATGGTRRRWRRCSPIRRSARR
jgi:pimeloyl-ACP methyl ester carboxylesterase